MKARATLALSLLLLATPALGAGFQAVKQVSDQPGVAPTTDPDLVNAWGLAQASDSSPLWVSDNGTGVSTLYDRSTGAKLGLTVTIPGGAPTGIAFVSSGFTIQSQQPIFLFDNEAGQISGWSSGTTAVVAVDRSAQGASYKGLAVDNATHLLFAADFANGHVDIFDTNFTRVGSFTDGTLPSRYAPFNVAIVNGKVFVAFALREKGGTDEVAGPGYGFVDVFNENGIFQRQLVVQGELNAPWGMTIAPPGFGALEGALLVGNFGDGRINAYRAGTGDFIETLKRPSGAELKIPGLWALDAGPGANVQYSAGPEDETHGEIGLIQAR
jgi:uncharacterized protein (TIGR03118 family)